MLTARVSPEGGGIHVQGGRQSASGAAAHHPRPLRRARQSPSRAPCGSRESSDSCVRRLRAGAGGRRRRRHQQTRPAARDVSRRNGRPRLADLEKPCSRIRGVFVRGWCRVQAAAEFGDFCWRREHSQPCQHGGHPAPPRSSPPAAGAVGARICAGICSAADPDAISTAVAAAAAAGPRPGTASAVCSGTHRAGPPRPPCAPLSACIITTALAS